MILGPGMQYFSIYLPSPTTVSFTVSTRPLHNPVPVVSTSTNSSRVSIPRIKARIFTVLKHVLRALFVFVTALVNVVKAQGSVQSAGPRLDAYADLLLHLSPFNSFIRFLADKAEWWVLASLSLVVMYACLRRDHVEESLLVLQGLGIQTSTSSRYFFTGATTTFIPTTQIQDIVIHEAFKGLEVRFYLAVIVEGATEVVVVFPTLLPRRDILEEVWRGSRKCLYSGIR
ncbi:phosphatidylinositol glycan, class H [Cladophialophora yegresii CBS 114405]|uniref:Phosphatidylinositol glycan, class H n=1 Tax=Cladophialophora yegresii CBS 114405 TaxID=1182544 RepID=W9VYJ1_9EURO|nr:phosphatidylinositol glycan, class H [Cladophialophora yegresii CBS 114405]EXJ57316.1 phosphatidylinositol glycan, class H [Cladophialophora yegresii CBS 114405]